MSDGDESRGIGIYANYLVVGHNAFEFVLDLGQLYQGGGDPQIHTRIVTAPVYAKAMLATLNSSVAQFESQYGPIQDSKDPQDPKDPQE